MYIATVETAPTSKICDRTMRKCTVLQGVSLSCCHCQELEVCSCITIIEWLQYYSLKLAQKQPQTPQISLTRTTTIHFNGFSFFFFASYTTGDSCNTRCVCVCRGGGGGGGGVASFIGFLTFFEPKVIIIIFIVSYYARIQLFACRSLCCWV